MKAQQLKNAILQLAIQGKLVPQDPNDEPASVLLEKIQAEKERLIAEGKIKKSKKTSDKLPYPENIEFPFEIPESWVWVTLEEITAKITDGSHNPPGNKGFGIPLLSAANIFNNKINFDTANRWISNDEWFAENKRTELELNDILLTIVGTIGRTAIIQDNRKFALQRSVAVLKPIFFSSQYLSFILQTPYLMERMIAESQGTAQKGIYLNTLKSLSLPLPPLDEQKRIVTKLEEILPFIDEYDKKEQKLTALQTQFPEQLKKSILQAAIQGKLVEQDPYDEPASKLLQRIKAEKARLILEKKIKKPKVQSEIVMRDNCPYEIINGVERCIADEVPFEIPKSWAWARLENFANNHDNQRKPVSVEYRKNQNKIYDYYGATGAIDKVEEYLFDGKYVLIGEDGGNFFVNRDAAFIVKGKFWANNHVHILSTPSGLEEYFCFYLNALNLPAMGLINGIAVPKLNQKSLNSILIAVPPINEQNRIVQEIEKLFSYLDNL